MYTHTHTHYVQKYKAINLAMHLVLASNWIPCMGVVVSHHDILLKRVSSYKKYTGVWEGTPGFVNNIYWHKGQKTMKVEEL
jgi:hypothetical protein